ncbi:MAG: SDR family NAD(P)-dependent oxidoreductase, partial [Actinomycetota bacterium]|nr:SDR family NAD(P)-dependent oxidoreductase [Actinomycetota bacterium]
MIGQTLATAARVRRRVTGAPSPLAGRVVLVTGASSGIGEHTAYAVARVGARVLLVARRTDELERVAEAVRALGAECATYTCDLTDGEAVDALVVQVLAEHGHVDHLVNNAGRSIRCSLAASADRIHDVERTKALNYLGPG